MSSPEVAPAKICVACGQDCANKPRIKDARGRYFCQPCFQKLEQKQKAAAAPPAAMAVATAPKAPAARPAPRAPAAPGADLLDDLAKLAAAAPAAEVERTCPACSAPLAPNAVFCTGCGYNLQTGQRVGTQALKATKTHKPRSSSSVNVSGIFANPLVLGGVVMGIVLVLFLIARSGNELSFVYLGPVGIFSFVVGILVLISAFKESVLTGILCLCVPFYALYFVLAKLESTHLKVAFGTAILAQIIGYAAFPNPLLSGAFSQP
jgi:hypothetical protein